MRGGGGSSSADNRIEDLMDLLLFKFDNDFLFLPRFGLCCCRCCCYIATNGQIML